MSNFKYARPMSWVQNQFTRFTGVQSAAPPDALQIARPESANSGVVVDFDEEVFCDRQMQSYENSMLKYRIYELERRVDSLNGGTLAARSGVTRQKSAVDEAAEFEQHIKWLVPQIADPIKHTFIRLVSERQKAEVESSNLRAERDAAVHRLQEAWKEMARTLNADQAPNPVTGAKNSSSAGVSSHLSSPARQSEGVADLPSALVPLPPHASADVMETHLDGSVERFDATCHSLGAKPSACHPMPSTDSSAQSGMPVSQSMGAHSSSPADPPSEIKAKMRLKNRKLARDQSEEAHHSPGLYSNRHEPVSKSARFSTVENRALSESAQPSSFQLVNPISQHSAQSQAYLQRPLLSEQNLKKHDSDCQASRERVCVSGASISRAVLGQSNCELGSQRATCVHASDSRTTAPFPQQYDTTRHLFDVHTPQAMGEPQTDKAESNSARLETVANGVSKFSMSCPAPSPTPQRDFSEALQRSMGTK